MRKSRCWQWAITWGVFSHTEILLNTENFGHTFNTNGIPAIRSITFRWDLALFVSTFNPFNHRGFFFTFESPFSTFKSSRFGNRSCSWCLLFDFLIWGIRRFRSRSCRSIRRLRNRSCSWCLLFDFLTWSIRRFRRRSCSWCLLFGYITWDSSRFWGNCWNDGVFFHNIIRTRCWCRLDLQWQRRKREKRQEILHRSGLESGDLEKKEDGESKFGNERQFTDRRPADVPQVFILKNIPLTHGMIWNASFETVLFSKHTSAGSKSHMDEKKSRSIVRLLILFDEWSQGPVLSLCWWTEHTLDLLPIQIYTILWLECYTILWLECRPLMTDTRPFPIQRTPTLIRNTKYTCVSGPVLCQIHRHRFTRGGTLVRMKKEPQSHPCFTFIPTKLILDIIPPCALLFFPYLLALT